MRFYRYRPFNPKFLESELLQQQVYLWHLDQQNDPFEGQVIYRKSVGSDDLYHALIALRDSQRASATNLKKKGWLFGPDAKKVFDAQKLLLEATDQMLLERAKSAIENNIYEDPKILQAIEKSLRKMTHQVTIACFSAARLSPTMFAHYGGNHSGICIEYDVDDGILHPLSYTEEIPNISLIERDKNALVKARILTKHLDWKHESEYRLVQYDRRAGLYRNPGIKITDIYAGFKMSESSKKELLNLKSFWGRPKFNMWQVLPREDSYSFLCAPLEG